MNYQKLGEDALFAEYEYVVPATRIVYGWIKQDGQAIKAGNHSCHAGLFRSVLQENRTAPLLWSRQYNTLPYHRAGEAEYIAWLASDECPWKSLKRTYIPDKSAALKGGWLIPTDQPGNLLLNFFIATRSPFDSQARWAIATWHRLVQAGVKPAVAYLFTEFTEPSGSNDFLLGKELTNHQPIEARRCTTEVAQRFVSGRPTQLSVPYTENPEACTPCNIIWGTDRGMNISFGSFDDSYMDYLKETYVQKGSTIPSYRQQVFGTAPPPRQSYTALRQSIPFSLLLDMALNEQNRLELHS